jgi:hypothetical protein
MQLFTGTGQVWPSESGAAADPGTSFTASSRIFRLGEESALLCKAVVSAGACRALEVLTEYSTNNGTDWEIASKVAIPGGTLGQHPFGIELPGDNRGEVWLRMSVRRYGGSAATRVVVNATVVDTIGDLQVEGQPLELAGHQSAGIECWSDGAGAAALLPNTPAIAPGPAAPAGSIQWIPSGNANTIELDVTISTSDAATVELQIWESPDNLTTTFVETIDTGSLAGIVPERVRSEQIVGTIGHRKATLPVTPNRMICVAAQYTTSVGTPKALILARLLKIGDDAGGGAGSGGGGGGEVDIRMVKGTAVVEGGVAGLLGVGINKYGGTDVVTGGVAGLPGAGINKWGGTDVVTGGVAVLPGVGINKVGGTDIVTGGVAGLPGVGVNKVGGTDVENGGVAGLLGVGLNRVGGTAVPSAGIAGVLATGGTGAHGAAEDALYPLKLGAVTRLVEAAALTTAYKTKLFADVFSNLNVVDRSHDYGIQANRIAEISPLNMKFDPISFNRPNITAAGWVYDYFPMDGALGFALQFIAAITGGDVLWLTVGYTLQDDGTVPASCSYEDITPMLNSGGPYILGSKGVQVNTNFGAKYGRIGYYVTGGNTTDVIVHGKRWY